MEQKALKKGTAQLIVNESCTAAALGSGLLRVLATPRLVALMEEAACNALLGMLPEEQTTVGTRIDVSHTSATPIGMRVVAQATLTEADGRAFSFSIEAFDEAGAIGHATHTRFAVHAERFMQKTNTKKQA